MPQETIISPHVAETITIHANKSALSVTDDGKVSFVLNDNLYWHSNMLGVLHYYDRQHPRKERVAVPSGNSHEMGTAGTLSLSATSTVKVKKESTSSLRIDINFPSLSVDITLCFSLLEDGDGFNVNIVNVVENHAKLYRLLGLELLPEFGFAKTGEEGYLTLPNWSGCQTFFDKDYPREVWQTIYSSNDQWENNCNAPVFGITRSHGTLCGIVAEGDEDAQLVSRVHWERQQANSTHPYLVWRWEQQDERIEANKRVQYTFAPSDAPTGEGYAFVGTEYRNFLSAERGVQSWVEKAKTRPEAMDYAERFFLKIFMGYKVPTIKGDGDYHCTTTCDEAREIIQQCLDRGMKKLTVILVGWGQDGHDGQAPKFFPVDERVGGEEKMKELVSWAKENDVMLGVHTCFADVYSCSPEFSMDDIIQHRSGEAWEGIIWSGGQAHRPCPSAMKKFVERDMKELKAHGFHGHHHFDCIGGFSPCYSEKHPLPTRSAFIEAVRENVRLAIDNLGGVSTEMPYGQYFAEMDGFFHSFSKVYNFLKGCDVGKYFLDKVIPLIEIALHGSHQCGEKVLPIDKMLHHLDFGLSPQLEVCVRPSPQFGIPSYDSKAQMLEEAYAFTYGPEGYMTKVGKFEIEARWELAPDVTRTRYSNGQEVIVNQSDQAFNNVQAHDYQWL